MDRKNTNQTGWPVPAAKAAEEAAAANDVVVYPSQNHMSHQTQPPGSLPPGMLPRPPPGLAPVVPFGLMPPGPTASPAHYPLYPPYQPWPAIPAHHFQPRTIINYGPIMPVQRRDPGYFPDRLYPQGYNDDDPGYPMREGSASSTPDTSSAGEQAFTPPPTTPTTAIPAPNMDYYNDLLTSPYPTPSTGRRCRQHIRDMIDRVNIVQQAPPRPPRFAVPWHNAVQAIDPETEAAPEARFEPMRTVNEKLRRFTLQGEGSMTPGARALSQLPSPPSEPSNLRKMMCKASGFSTNYKGDICNKANRSANIDDDLNCSLWIVGLYAGMTVSRLLRGVGSVGPTGKIWATVVSDANPAKGHPGAAAKIVFFDRAGAERLKAAIEAHRLNNIVGHSVRVSYNRIRSAPQLRSDNSRVVYIWGPPSLVNHKRLERLFMERLEFQTEAVILHDDPHQAVLEWRFGSFRAQAQAVCLFLGKEHSRSLQWRYGPDPCATGQYMTGGVDVTHELTI